MTGGRRQDRSLPPSLPAAPGRLQGLLHRVQHLTARAGSRRVMIGAAGPPGAGKSTVTGHLRQVLQERGTRSAVVGMDGFHLAQAELERLGRQRRKGAPDTFDAHGYVALLHRLREHPAHTVYAPRYVREALEEPIGSAVPVPPGVQVVLTEGNYLLLPQEPWDQIPRLLDEVWFIGTGEDVRRQRLLARHLAAGKSQAEALAFTDGSDAANADLIAATRHRADLIIDWD